MKKTKFRSKAKMTVLLLTFIAVAVFVSNSYAKEKKHGAELLIQTQDGKIIKAELLAVKGSSLVLMDNGSLSGITVDIKKLKSIRIVKKSKLLQGLGSGLLIGGASGALLGFLSGDDSSGWFRMTAEQKALAGGVGLAILGAPIGGIWGAVKGIDESIFLEGKPEEDISKVLKKLAAKARFSSELPEILRKDKKDIGEKILPSQNTIKTENKIVKKPTSQRFTRIHLSFIPGYFSSHGVADLKGILESAGFDEDEYHSGGFFSSSSYTVEYPDVLQNPVLYIKEIKVEYSISKKIALGFSYSPLGLHRVSGRKIMPRNDYREWIADESYLTGKYSGSIYFLTASFMPTPDAFLKKFSFKIGAGLGYGKINAGFMISLYKIWGEEEENGSFLRIDKTNFSFNSLGLILSGGCDYFFSSNWSIGINVDYKYVPCRIDSFQLAAPYSYYPAPYPSNRVFDSEMVHIPSRRMNLGGVGVGINFSFHF
jgi:opacity protein-like surface antigen